MLPGNVSCKNRGLSRLPMGFDGIVASSGDWIEICQNEEEN